MDTEEKENLPPETEEAEDVKEAVTENTEAAEAKEPENAEAAEETEKESTGGIFKKKKDKKDKKDEKIEALTAKNDELSDKYLRLQAEFVNFRNRTDKEKLQSFDLGSKNVLEKILPIIDNLERGLALLDDTQKEEPFAQGIDKVYKQLMQVLEGMDVKQMECVGQEFDPNFHNAVMHVEDDNAGENVIVEEFQKGYLFHDTVLRHAMVKVAN